MWAAELFDLLIWKADLDTYGIWPRTTIGLRNILLAPFLHVGLRHLIANTVPFVVLGWLVMVRSTREFVLVSVLSMLVSGVGIWILGSTNSVHLGASGVIFGYLGYLLARGYFERSLQSILIAIIILFFYGGMLWGVLPLQSGVSWLGHTFGLIGGAWSAYIIAQGFLR